VTAGAAVPDAPPPVPSAATAPGLLRVWPRVAAVVAVVMVGLVAAWVTWRDAHDDADRREQLVAEQTASLTTSTVQQVLAAISGVSGLPAADGRVDRAGFDAYVWGVLAESPLQTLAYAPVVPAADRPAVEAAIGRSFRDTPGGPPAGPRPEYMPVQWVTPGSELTDQLIGFDLAADPVRSAAAATARDSGAAVISQTVPSQPSGKPAVFLVHAVYRPGLPEEATVAERRRAVVGYVTTGVLGERLLGAITDQTEETIGLRVVDVDAAGQGPLMESDPPPDQGATVERAVAGRTWRITVDDRQPVTTSAPWWILVGTAALALTLAGLAWRALHHQREIARHVEMVERVADLGRTLAAAGSVDDIARVVDADLPAVLEAASASLALVDRSSNTIRPRHGPGGPDGPVPERDAEIPLDSPLPLARAAHDGTPIVLTDDEDRRARGPAEVDRAAEAGLGATACWPVTDGSGEVVAALGVSWSREGPVDDLTLATLATAAELTGQTLGRARLADAVRRDAVTSRLLAGLAEAAATAGTVDQVARTLVDGATDVAGARSAQIGLLTPAGDALAVVRHDSLEPGSAAGHERQQVDWPWPLVTAFTTEAPVLLPDREAVATRFPAVAGDVRAAGLAAIACLPLVGDDGVPFGAVGLAWDSPRRFDAALVDTLRTTADLCASSLGRARGTDLAQARAAALATLAAHLSTARSFEDVGAAIVEDAPAALEADFAIVGVVDEDQFRMLAPSGPGLDVLAHYADLDLGGDFPALIALRRRELVTFTDLGAVPDATVAADLASLGLHGGACAPLIGADGEALGVLSVLWASPPLFDDALLGRITTVADLCGQSAERARLFDAEHRVRRDLQARVLPRIPAVPPFEVAARYRPAAPSVGMGGDWYDGIALGPGRLCLVLGDVTGHGVEAIAEMTQVRTVVHTLAAGGMALPDILARTSSAMQREGGGYATLVVAVIDAGANSVSYVTAGHPPPLVRRPDGTIDVLADGHHSVLGVNLAPRPAGRAPFPSGSVLVAYTDGLIERRGTTIDASVERLAAQLAFAPETGADALADRLLHVNRSTVQADDLALVVALRPR
jgi:GAF domain-containing protein/CHASE1-domain containing sensor protein